MLFHSDKRLKKVVFNSSVGADELTDKIFGCFISRAKFYFALLSLKRTELAVYLCHVHYSATYLTVTKKEISKSISNSQT